MSLIGEIPEIQEPDDKPTEETAATKYIGTQQSLGGDKQLQQQANMDKPYETAGVPDLLRAPDPETLGALNEHPEYQKRALAMYNYARQSDPSLNLQDMRAIGEWASNNFAWLEWSDVRKMADYNKLSQMPMEVLQAWNEASKMYDYSDKGGLTRQGQYAVAGIATSPLTWMGLGAVRGAVSGVAGKQFKVYMGKLAETAAKNQSFALKAGVTMGTAGAEGAAWGGADSAYWEKFRSKAENREFDMTKVGEGAAMGAVGAMGLIGGGYATYKALKAGHQAIKNEIQLYRGSKLGALKTESGRAGVWTDSQEAAAQYAGDTGKVHVAYAHPTRPMIFNRADYSAQELATKLDLSPEDGARLIDMAGEERIPVKDAVDMLEDILEEKGIDMAIIREPVKDMESIYGLEKGSLSQGEIQSYKVINPDILFTPQTDVKIRVPRRQMGAVGDVSKVNAPPAKPKQEFSSADTSIRQVPAAFKKIGKYLDGTEGRNLDIGGGKYDDATEHMKNEYGLDSRVIDPFNRTPEHNAAVKAWADAEPVDTATIANVLNVIKEPEIRQGVIQQGFDAVKPGGKVFISTYEGNRTGVGKVTTKGFQNNRKTADYVTEVEEIFGEGNVTRYGDVIVAQKPEPKVGVLEQRVRSAGGAKALLTVTSPHEPSGKVIAGDIKPHLGDTHEARLNEILTTHPAPLRSADDWEKFMTDVAGKEVPPAPTRAMEYAQDPKVLAEEVAKLNPEQVRFANEGLNMTKEIRKLYDSGEADEAFTAKMFMWSYMSKQTSAFPHEAGFLELVTNGVDEFIDQAVEGKFDLEAYKKWTSTLKLKGRSPAAMVTNNINDFGATFLRKLSVKGADGKSGLKRLHEMIADTNVPSRVIRREFFKLAEKTGIDNKVLSFTLLMSGRHDVIVIDRIQNRHFWDDPGLSFVKNLYEGDNKETAAYAAWKAGGKKGKAPKDKAELKHPGMQHHFNGYRGLALYEALEDGLGSSVEEAYRMAGRTEPGTVGRLHWETWVARSGQEVGHGTIEGMVRSVKEGVGAYSGITSREGRYHQYNYGHEYSPKNGGTYYVPDTSGEMFEMDYAAYAEFNKQVKAKRKDGVTPEGFKVSDSRDKPWYNQPGVNTDKLNELVHKYGKDTGKVSAEAAEANQKAAAAQGAERYAGEAVQQDSANGVSPNELEFVPFTREDD